MLRRCSPVVLALLTVFALVVGLAPTGSAAPSAAGLRKELDETLDRISDAQDRDAKLRDELTRLHRMIAADEKELAGVRARLGRRARIAYTGGIGGDSFAMMMSADDPADVVERLALLDAATAADRAALVQSKVVRRRLEGRYARFTQARRDSGRLVAQMRADNDRLNRLLAAVGQAENLAERESARRGQRASRSAPAPRLSGRYACLVGPNHAFRDTWGAPRSGGRRHKGTDVFAPMGSPSYAVTSGVVTRTSTSTNGGLGLYLRGDDGNEYYYSHMSSFVVRRGRVAAGQLIARVGDTGNARGGAPHVHFEVHPGGGSPVNPYPYVRRFCG